MLKLNLKSVLVLFTLFTSLSLRELSSDIIFRIISGGGVLVHLVLSNQIVGVAFGLGEGHLVHAFSSVPVEERLPPEHGREALSLGLESRLLSSGVAN